jgi:hypothetical protein
MQLNKLEATVLKRYQRHLQTNPTFFDALRRGRLWTWVVLSVAAAFGLMAIAPNASPRYGWFLLGFITGTVYMVFAGLSRSLRLWKVHREIIDWKKVDELLQQNEGVPPKIAVD